MTLTCTCGCRQTLRYGERWTCESCGTSWDTSQIPREEYNQIRRIQLRFRAAPTAIGVLAAGFGAFLILSGNIAGVILLPPIALLTWFLVRGVHRRRYEAAIAKRHSWTLRGEQP